MVSEKYRSKFSHRKTQSTIALDQSALLELLGELKLTDVTDRIRVATETQAVPIKDRLRAARGEPTLCHNSSKFGGVLQWFT